MSGWPGPFTVAETQAIVAEHQPIDPDAEVVLCRRCSEVARKPRRWPCPTYHAVVGQLTRYGYPLVADGELTTGSQPCSQG